MDRNFHIPKKIVIGLIKESDDTKGIISYIGRNGKIVQEKQFRNLVNDEYIEVDNIPRSGFLLYRKELILRTSYTWYKDDRISIKDKDGFYFNISTSNFINILDNCDIVNKALCGEFVFSWGENNGELTLLSTESKEYKEALKVNRPEKEYTSSDLIPGTKYRFKKGRLSYSLCRDWDNPTGIFIGNVKISKSFYGKRFETKCLFYSPNENDSEKGGNDFLFLSNPKDVDYPIKENYIDNANVNNILSEFNNTAYSFDFWNSNKKIVDSVELLDLKDFPINIKERIIVNDKNSVAVYNNNCIFGKEFYYLKKYITYVDDPTNHYRYNYSSKSLNDYISCKFSITNGILKVSEVISDLGKCPGMYSSSNSIPGSATIEKIYTNCTPKDIQNAKIGNKYYDKGTATAKMILYKTENGKYSESLQVVLSEIIVTSMEDLPKKLLDRKLYLPE